MNLNREERLFAMVALRAHAGMMDTERRSRKLAGPDMKPTRDFLKERAAKLRVLAHRIEAEGVGAVPRGESPLEQAAERARDRARRGLTPGPDTPLAVLTRNLTGGLIDPTAEQPRSRTQVERADAADIARGYSGLS